MFEIQVGSLVEAVGLSSAKVNGLRGVVTRIQSDGRMVVDLPIGDAALKEENLQNITSCGNWERVTSSSTSPGDSYWYNYETEVSCWEVPEEILKANESIPTIPSDDFSFDTSNSESKRSYTGIESEGSEQTEETENDERQDSAATAEAERKKQEQLLSLKSKLELLESKKRRKTTDMEPDVQQSQALIDKQLSSLTPNAVTGLRALPVDVFVEEAD